MDPDPDSNWAKILDPDPNIIRLDPQHCLGGRILCIPRFYDVTGLGEVCFLLIRINLIKFKTISRIRLHGFVKSDHYEVIMILSRPKHLKVFCRFLRSGNS